MTLTELHNEHGRYLLTCLRLYGVPEQECEDVRQDLYLKLLENETDLTKVRHARGFCSTITRRVAIDWLRKNSRAPSVESCVVVDENGIEAMHPEIDAIMVSRWESIVANTNVGRIEQALELAQMHDCRPGGPTAHEVVADLLYGLTMEQIGEKHGVNKSTVSRWVKEWYEWIGAQLPAP